MAHRHSCLILASVLEVNKDAEIYIPASFWGNIPQRKLTVVDKPVQTLEAVFSTGELQGIEQSLLIKTAQCIVVVAGCSYPGVGLILDATAQYGKVYEKLQGLKADVPRQSLSWPYPNPSGQRILSSLAVGLPARLRDFSGQSSKNEVLNVSDFEAALYTGEALKITLAGCETNSLSKNKLRLVTQFY
jgi:hypothetical protein